MRTFHLKIKPQWHVAIESRRAGLIFKTKRKIAGKKVATMEQP